MRITFTALLVSASLALPAAAGEWLGGNAPPAGGASQGKAGINAGGGTTGGGTGATGGSTTGGTTGSTGGGGLTGGAGVPVAVAGTWACVFTNPSDPSTDGSTAVITYRPDGTSAAEAIFLIPALSGGRDRLFMSVEGTWSLQGATLTEAMTGFDIVAYEQEGQRISFEQLPAEIQMAYRQGLQSMVGVSTDSEVTMVDGGHIIVREIDSGAISDCTKG